MKKWFFLLSVVAFVLFLNAGVSAAKSKAPAEPEPPKLVLDGNVLKPVVPPIIKSNYIMVPIRTVAENLGYTADYDKTKKQITVKKGNTNILMTLGEKTALVNGRQTAMQLAPTLQSDYTFVPLRFVGEAFGVQFYWDSQTRAAFMISGESSESNEGGHAPSDGEQGGDSPSDGGEQVGNGSAGNGEQGSSNPGDGTGAGTGTGTNEGSDPATPVTDGTLHEIRYEPDNLVVKYSGTLSPKLEVLNNPDRIVLDLPSADYDAAFFPAIAMPTTSGEFTVAEHEALQKVRYAVNSESPRTIRIVLDLSQRWAYDVTNDSTIGELRLTLKKPEQQRFTVVLDAGHGGSDPGAKSVTGKWEKAVNLAIVLKVQALLAGEPRINLVLTRQGDTYPTLDERIAMANNLQASLFVSVHSNSNDKATINGMETYYNRPDSLEFAKLLHSLAVPAAGMKDNGVRTAGFKVIKYTTMPAVLLEVGYLSNKSDEQKLYDNAFQDRVAQAIAASIKQYFHL